MSLGSNLKFRISFIFLFAAAAIVCLGCSAGITNRDSKGTEIICFGNSLTEGVGADEGKDFPSQLSEKLGIDVINAGKKGETTRGALRRLYSGVLEYGPKLVIVEFGANDFFQRIPKEETFSNLDKIVTSIQKTGSMVAIVAVRLGIFSDEYTKGFKEIANKRGAIFIPNIMAGILSNPSLKYDGIHPNSEGYGIIAERVHRKIAPFLK